jgi:hypothetical protein
LDPAVRRTDVDGVPTFFGSLPGPLRASLTFRVGQADETMSNRGITHLIEHLALTESERSPHDYNAATGRTLTNFVVAAEPAEVGAHLQAICEALGQLPAHRLDHERRVLEAEAASRRGRLTLPLWRWGAQGFGLVAYDETGLAGLDIDEIQAWSDAHFTRGNAVLWLSARPPKGLTLPLPDGPLLPVGIDPHASVVPLPGWATANGATTALSYLTARTAAGQAVGAVLSERLTRTLRHEQGLVYGVEAGLDRITGEVAEHLFLAAGTPGSEVEVADQVCKVLIDLRDNGVTAEELAQLVERNSAQPPDEAPMTIMRLEAHAQSLLLGREPPKPPEVYEDEIKALLPEAVDAEVAKSFATLLLEVPGGAKVPPRLATPLPQWSGTVLTGKQIRPTRRHPAAKRVVLRLAPAGVSLVTPQGPVTIKYDDVVAMTPYSDGSRALLARDGFTLNLLAEQWTRPKQITAALDAGVPRSVWLSPVERTTPLSGGSRWKHALRGTRPLRIGLESQWIRASAIATAILLAVGLTSQAMDDVPPPTNSAPPFEGLAEPDIAQLTAGQCLFSTAGSDLSIVVPCGELHSREVFAAPTLPGAPDAVRARAQAECARRIGTFTTYRRTALVVTVEVAAKTTGQSAAVCEVAVKGEEFRSTSLEGR